MSQSERLTLSDLFLILGALCMTAGVWVIFWPAGLVVLGALLILVGWVVFD